MIVNKYIKNNNIIHEVNISNFHDLTEIIDFNIFLERNANFIAGFNKLYNDMNKDDIGLNIRYQKKYKPYGKNVKYSKLVTQNINCYKVNEKQNTIDIYYDLTYKYNETEENVIKLFTFTYILINQLKKYNYNVNFTPVMFLKAFDSIENNEYVFIKFYNLNIENAINETLIKKINISRTILPEIIKTLDIINKDALDYNGYLLESIEKENIIDSKNNTLIIDMFMLENLDNKDIKTLCKKINI